MGSAGQAGGFIGGAILGALLIPTAGISGLGLTQLGGIAMAATIGSLIGGLVDPPKLGQSKGQHEVRSVLYNTFENAIPVALVFGRFRIVGNVIFVGDTYGRLEDVGDQQVGQGKAEQTVDVNRVIYYADFVLGLCEGPIRAVDRVKKDDEDYSTREGDLFDVMYGDDDDTVPAIVSAAPFPVPKPVRWKGTAKIVWSGKLGEANRIPAITCEVYGHDLTVTTAATPTGLPSTVRDFLYFDDLSGLLFVLKTPDREFASFDRYGGDYVAGEVPSVTGAGTVLEAVFYTGRSDQVLAVMAPVGGGRLAYIGERDFDEDSAWQPVVVTEAVFGKAMSAYVVDDVRSILYSVHIGVDDTYLVATPFGVEPGAQTKRALGIGAAGSLVVYALGMDRASDSFLLLYTDDATTLTLRTYRVSDRDAEVFEQTVGYDWNAPVAVGKTGELVWIFDPGADRPYVLFELGRAEARYERGFRGEVSAFSPDQIEGLVSWLDADALGLADNTTVDDWTDQTENATPVRGGGAPKLRTARVNGLDAVVFASGDWFSWPALAVERSAVTIFAVCMPTGAAGDENPLIHSNDGSVLNPLTDEWEENQAHYLTFGGLSPEDFYEDDPNLGGKVWASEDDRALTGLFQTAVYNSWFIHAHRGDETGVRVWKDGVVAGNSGHGYGAEGDSSFKIGKGDGSRYFVGECAEILVFNRALTNDEIEKINVYLRTKYAINAPVSTDFAAASVEVLKAPVKAVYADRLHRMFVLDRDADGWVVKDGQWDGTNWSYVRPSGASVVRFAEESSAAGALYSVLQSSLYGGGLPTSFVDGADFHTLDRCSGYWNAPYDDRHYTTDPPRFGPRAQINYYLSSQKKLSAVVREMLASVGGYVYQEGGSLRFGIDAREDGVEASYDESAMVDGSFGFQEIGREDRHNRVSVTYYDRNRDYKPYPVTVSADWESDLYGESRTVELSATACTSPRQAVRLALANLYGNVLRRFACSFTLLASGLERSVGDLIYVSHPVPGWANKPFRVVTVRLNDDDTVALECVEHVVGLQNMTAWPLEEPRGEIETTEGTEASFDAVKPPARVAIVEDTLESRAWLFAAKGTDGGPWRSVAWLVKWDATTTPGAGFYPTGAIPSDAYETYVVASEFSACAELAAAVSTTDTTISLASVLGDPPEANFDLVIVNEDITDVEFGNPNGNGKYERIQCLSYDPTTKTVTTLAGGRGYGTNAVAHTPAIFNVVETFKQIAWGGVGGVTPPSVKPVRLWRDNAPGVNGYATAGNPLNAVYEEWYVGFDPAEFVAAGKYPRSLAFVDPSPPASPASPSVTFELYYSTGTGTWALLTGVSDGTAGFSQDGTLSWVPPTFGLWASTTQWIPGTLTNAKFPGYPSSGATNTARPYLKIRRIVGLTGSPRAVRLLGETTNSASSVVSPVVWFLRPNRTPFYDLSPTEVGFKLDWKARPVGIHGQTVPVDNAGAASLTIKNLAGETAI